MTIKTENHAAAEGTAYGRPTPKPDTLLTQVGPGTPCGEYLRRYWQPIAAAEKVTGRPQQIRILGEDLILFRNGNGQPGLLYPHCAHRGTSLLYGHVDDEGIRCCYHGWKFDVEGRCLDQPCEPGGGLNKAAVRQPWYAVEERYGLVWAYLGPPDKKPLLPRFEHLENLAGDERYYVTDNSVQSHADLEGPAIVPYSWLNIADNAMDPFHVYILHSNFGTTHFNQDFSVMPQVKWVEVANGVQYTARRELPNGRKIRRVTTWMAPNMHIQPGTTIDPPKALTIYTAVDDTHTRVFLTVKVNDSFTSIFDGLGLDEAKPWTTMSLEERQDAPGDYEAQSSQGPNGVPGHSDEHLGRSDIGVGLLRRVLRREIDKVQQGQDPINVAFVPGAEVISTESGNFLEE